MEATIILSIVHAMGDERTTPCQQQVRPFYRNENLPDAILPPTHDEHYPISFLLQEICALPPSLSGAVRRLSFSPDGQSLCGIGADRDSSLCIWRSASGKWSDGTRIALGQGPRRPALFVAWARGGDSAPYQVRCCLQNAAAQPQLEEQAITFEEISRYPPTAV